jgi:biopolymer transport protein ExbD
MQFRPKTREEPEINLIAFIDILLVVLIFLMLSTTYNKFTEMQLQLPVADAEKLRDYPQTLNISVGADASISLNGTPLAERGLEGITNALVDASKASKDAVLVISADASAKHQFVITIMEAARRAGLRQITFATQSSTSPGAGN